LVCRAALTVLKTIESDDLLTNSTQMGEVLAEGLATLVATVPGVLEVRGRGLMRGLGVDNDVIDRAAVVADARENGLLLTMAGPDALRLVPPLIVGRAHIAEAVNILRTVLMGAA
jgi:acetylornithine/N-succinyldiaminopimelate aminotransferase